MATLMKTGGAAKGQQSRPASLNSRSGATKVKARTALQVPQCAIARLGENCVSSLALVRVLPSARIVFEVMHMEIPVMNATPVGGCGSNTGGWQTHKITMKVGIQRSEA